MSIRPFIVLGAAIAALSLIVGDLQARPSSGGSFGSRGSRTFSAPATTPTAPKAAAPIERTVTQPSGPSTTGLSGTGVGSGLFNRPGLVGGLFAGFLGAGLFGMLFGHGLFGGLGGFASVLGLLIQIALVVIVARLIWTWWQRRQGLATASGPALRVISSDSRAYGATGAASSANKFGDKVVVNKSDYDDFERLLSDVSLAYGEENTVQLRTLTTPEMLSYFSEKLADNLSHGLVNKISDVKLLQGDLAEAWREGDVEYATVAMRYAITDATVERATGRLVEGADTPQEITELWTFLRTPGSPWVLSAIQQAQ